MSKVKPTKEQWYELNRRLDAVVEAGHTSDLYCDCELCQALAEQAKLMGYIESSTIKQPSKKWDRRMQTYEKKRQIDAIKVANLAGKGLSRAEICEKMHCSKAYVNRISKEFDIEIFTKKER